MSSREKFQQGDPITWLQVHNLLPLVGIIVAAIGVFNLLQTKVETQSQRIEYLDSAVNSCLTRTDSLEERLTNQSLDIKELQTKGEVKGVSTVKPRITPTPVDEP